MGSLDPGNLILAVNVLLTSDGLMENSVSDWDDIPEQASDLASSEACYYSCGAEDGKGLGSANNICIKNWNSSSMTDAHTITTNNPESIQNSVLHTHTNVTSSSSANSSSSSAAVIAGRYHRTCSYCGLLYVAQVTCLCYMYIQTRSLQSLYRVIGLT